MTKLLDGMNKKGQRPTPLPPLPDEVILTERPTPLPPLPEGIEK